MDARHLRQDRLCHDLSAPEYDQKVTRAFGAAHALGMHGWIRRQKRLKPLMALDDGTGTGVVALELAKVCEYVVGLDHSVGMLEVAQTKAESAGVAGRLSFIRGDCHRLPFGDGSFDLVTIQGLLHHHGSVQWRCALRESARVLKPGGRLYVSEPCLEANPMGRMFAIIAGVAIRLTRLISYGGRRGRGQELKSRTGEDTVTTLEGQMRSRQMVAELIRLGFDVTTRYLTELPEAVTLSEARAASIIRMVSAPMGTRFGDVVFIYATKGSCS